MKTLNLKCFLCNLVGRLVHSSKLINQAQKRSWASTNRYSESIYQQQSIIFRRNFSIVESKEMHRQNSRFSIITTTTIPSKLEQARDKTKKTQRSRFRHTDSQSPSAPIQNYLFRDSHVSASSNLRKCTGKIAVSTSSNLSKCIGKIAILIPQL